MPPLVFPLLVLGGGIIAILASKKSGGAAAAALPPGYDPRSSGSGNSGGVVTLPPTVIVGGGADTSSGVAPWSSGMSVPTRLPAIPASYLASSPETSAIQYALNGWIGTVGAPIAPLTIDGSYGHLTQAAAGAFQVWQNATNPAANLTIDGLAGPETQNFLLDFGPMTQGAY